MLKLIAKRWNLDSVHFCSATDVEYDNDDIDANVEDSSEDIVGEENCKPSMGVYYKRCYGRNETAQHINTVELNGAKLHKSSCRKAP